MEHTTALGKIKTAHKDGLGKILDASEILPPEKIDMLHRQAINGDKKAEERIINSVTRLVYQVTSKVYMSWSSQLSPSVDYTEIFQAGIIGVYDAIRKYDETSPAKFSTYAKNWIEMRARRELYEQLSLVKIGERAIISGAKEARESYSDYSYNYEHELQLGHIEEPADEDTLIEEVSSTVMEQKILDEYEKIDPRISVALRMRMLGHTCKEIEKAIGITHQRLYTIEARATDILIERGVLEIPARYYDSSRSTNTDDAALI
jgi:RNA polymerase sigma factor (sigma-70 family)